MEEIKLHPTGRRPIQFNGELLSQAEADRLISKGKRRENPKARWHELAVWKTAKGKIVAQIAYRTSWPGEAEAVDVSVFDQAADAVQWFEDHDPMSHVLGFPPASMYEESQRQLTVSITDNYRHTISRLCESLPDVVEVIE